MTKKIFLAIIISALFIAGCQETNFLGLNLLPENDLLNAQINDTATIIMKTEYKKNTITTNPNYLLLGSYSDPSFGLTKASFCTQVVQYLIPDIDSTTTLDSVVLTLALADDNFFYGLTMSSPEIKVYEITKDTLRQFNLYYSDEDINNYIDTTTDLIGEGKTYFYTPDSTTGVKKAIRLKLNDELGQKFIDNYKEYFHSDAKFTDLFKGIYVESSNQSGIFSFKTNLKNNPPVFGITLYYHNEEDPDSLRSYTLGYNSTAIRFNIFDHNYTGTEVEQAINTQDSITQNFAYIQSMAGTYVSFSFPWITQYKDITIHTAYLYLKVASDFTTKDYTPIEKLWIVGYDTTGIPYYIDEYSGQSEYQSFEISDNVYKINVTKLIEDMINGYYKDINYKLYIANLKDDSEPNRTIINTNSNPQNPSKLIITYTQKQ